MNSRYHLTFKSTFQFEKPEKLEKTSLNVKFFEWDYLHVTALKKETYFNFLVRKHMIRSLMPKLYNSYYIQGCASTVYWKVRFTLQFS